MHSFTERDQEETSFVTATGTLACAFASCELAQKVSPKVANFSVFLRK